MRDSTVDGFEAFLESYGIAAAFLIMLVKAAGVPIPIPGDVILLAIAARAAEGKVILWLAFAALLIAVVTGGTAQFLVARGPARQIVVRYGSRVGLTSERLDRVVSSIRRGGVFGIGLGVLTPGVRSAVVPACGVAGIPLALFLPGLALGSALDLGLHFAIGYAGAGLLATMVEPSPLLLIPVMALVGLGAWLFLGRRRGVSTQVAVDAWAQATCPACLLVGGIASLQVGPANLLKAES